MPRILAILLILAIGAPALEAQRPNTRQGFWISFGLGAGSLDLGGDVEDFARETGLSGYLRLGGTLSQTILIGGETNGWVKTIDGVTTQVGFLGPVAVFYPSATGSFYIKTAVGILTVEEDFISGTGFATSLGIGNEFRVGNNFSIVLFLNGIQSFGVEAKVDGMSTGINVDPNLVQLGVGVAWH